MGIEPLEPTRIARVRRARPRSDRLIMDNARPLCLADYGAEGRLGKGDRGGGGDGVPLEG
jgi:hypothetical protein